MSFTESIDTALVTGASAGIGATYADRLAQRGHPLVLVARHAARLEALAERLVRDHRGRVEILTADLTVPAERLRVEQRLREDTRIGMLVNNAGIASGSAIASTPADVHEAMIQLNVVAPTRLVAALLPRLLHQGRGSIINIGSVLALTPDTFGGSYAASKSYLLSYTQALHAEIAEQGVRVQVVLPGVTRTHLQGEAGERLARIPAEWVMEVDEMVDAALAGFDAGELVTLPSLPDPDDWERFETARHRLAPMLSRDHAADRYKSDIPEDA
ncbi:SDR family oxidoreductase [Dyella sp. ASV21]|uniref:SDR family NAD(P)-dependent oxidoreductase n=1 Tax=Dyella sp. ASV21 TaxID=2795114 RepID=UPI0018EABAFA